MPQRPRPRVHARDHEHGGADPQRIHYETVGNGAAAASGLPSFAGWHGIFTSLGGTPAFLPVSIFSATTSLFTDSSGFVEITGPGMYQMTAYAQVSFISGPPSSDTTAWLWTWFYDSTANDVGWSIEEPNAHTANNSITFPAGVNQFRWLQRIYPISLTSAAHFPVTFKPEITFGDDTALRVQTFAVWGHRTGEPLDSSLSD